MQQKEFKKIIRFAINNEVKAQQFYASVSKKLKDPRLKEMFKQFAMEEANHKAILEQLCDECIHYLSSVKASDFNISENVENPVISSDMKPADAIAVAMKNEEEAMRMYMALAKKITDTRQKIIFSELAEMERLHKSKMERAFLKAAYPEKW